MEPRGTWPRSARATWWLDVAVAAAVGGAALAGQVAATLGATASSAPLRPVPAVLAATLGAVLIGRRRWPLAVLGAEVLVVVVAAGAAPPGLAGAAVAGAAVVACFAVGSWSERRPAAAVVVGALALLVVVSSAASGDGWVVALTVACTLLVLPAVAGVAARSRRHELEEVRARLAEAEVRQGEREQLAIQEERTRIARELHDVVAHHVSLIGVQAGAARAALDAAAPDDTRAALQAIEASSRQAVGEMRQLVEVLEPGGPATRAPAPGLADLGPLVERWRQAGYDLVVEAPAVDDLGPTLSLTCYRIVEEALANVARHSAARSAAVAVRPSPGAVDVLVHDPGPARTAAVADVGGRGLAGMAERAGVLGGTVSAGSTAHGGYSVVVHLPRAVPR